MLGKSLGIFLGLLVILYLALVAMLYVYQEKVIFAGQPLSSDYQFQFALPFEELDIDVEGGRLNALHFRQKNPQGVIFFLHGNAGNLVDWTENIEWYQENNYDLFIFDYRGYGKSTGSIQSQEQLMQDVRGAWQTMSSLYPEPLPIVIYGRSLGSSLAAHLAAEVETDLVVLVSAFSSMAAMARQQYPYVPAALLRYPLRTDEVIGKITSPLLLIHGDQDAFIPISHSQQLQQLAPAGTELLSIAGANHSDIHRFPSYLEGLARHLPGSGSG